MALSFVFSFTVITWIAVHLLLEKKLTNPKLRWVRILWFFALPIMFTVGTFMVINIEDPPPFSSPR